MLDIETYQKKIGKTDISNHDVDFYKDGMIEEIGEIFGIMKRIKRGDYKKMAKKNHWSEHEMWDHIRGLLIEEGGDFSWYFVRFLTKRGIHMSDMLDFNYEKITRRKKENKIMGEGHR